MDRNDKSDIELKWSALLARIQPHAELLGKQGRIALKTRNTRRYWVLRFELPRDSEGHRRNCTIYIGREKDVELVSRTLNLLCHFRDRCSRVEEMAIFARVAASWTAVLRRLARQS